jgi:chemosensory pili system protein ChpA (sensor histidine kinase/response regulator)
LYDIYDQITLGVESSQEGIDKEWNINIDTLELNNQDNKEIVSSVRVEDGLDINDNETVKTPLQQSDSIRVSIHRLDEIVRLVGELVINRSVFEQHLTYLLHQVEELHLSIDRLQRTSSTIETQYEVSALLGGHSMISTTTGTGLHRAGADWSGITEFDELEFDRYSDFHLMSRDLTETSADIGALGTEFRELLSEFDSYLTRQSRLTSDIQDKLMHFRMIPLSTLSTRLHRAIRVTAKQRNKEASLVIEGEEVQFDKTMLDELNEALLHILRNAVDHGIEAPEHRLAIGKSRQGIIRLCAYREGTQIVVQINDDGAGLNSERIRVKALENGLVTESEVMSWSDEKLYTLIFYPGFSTAQQVSEVSGRGVGMDIVHEIVTKLKGRINIQSTPGSGVTLTIRLPVTLALTQVLLVEVNHQIFAIPLADVLQVCYIGPEQVETVSDVQVISINQKITPIFWLAETLNLVAAQLTNEDRVPLIVMQIGNQQIAFIVDHLLGGREVVVKSLGMHLNHIYGFIGATLMGDGTIVLILNPNELIQEQDQRVAKHHIRKSTQRNKISEVYEILIVDDSFSVRRVVANLVKKAGWEPILAKNGLEALEILQRIDQLPDLVILDVEMPQMDGYELTSTLRANPKFRKLPIVMLTSRAGNKHRQKAFEVGATDYIVKPYRDTVLIKLISKLILGSREYSIA